MKKIIIYIALVTSYLFGEYEQKIEYIFDNIQAPKKELNKIKLNSTKDPFVIKKKVVKNKNLSLPIPTRKNQTNIPNLKKPEKKVLKKRLLFGVQGILDSQVLIDGKWYKKGQYLRKKFLIKQIDKNQVKIQNRYSKRVYKIKLGEKNAKIKINIF